MVEVVQSITLNDFFVVISIAENSIIYREVSNQRWIHQRNHRSVQQSPKNVQPKYQVPNQDTQSLCN